MLAPNEESKSKYSRGRSMVAVDRSGGRYEEPSNSYALANPHNLFNSLMKEHQQTMKAFDNMSSDLMSFGLRRDAVKPFKRAEEMMNQMMQNASSMIKVNSCNSSGSKFYSEKFISSTIMGHDRRPVRRVIRPKAHGVYGGDKCININELG